ncbi:hypothetical protein [Nostoc flagelliforme]
MIEIVYQTDSHQEARLEQTSQQNKKFQEKFPGTSRALLASDLQAG